MPKCILELKVAQKYFVGFVQIPLVAVEVSGSFTSPTSIVPRQWSLHVPS